MTTPGRGIVSVLQTPFDEAGGVDSGSFERLVLDALEGGAGGFLVPVVASEVAWLSDAERRDIVERAARTADGRVPLTVGASSDDPGRAAAHGVLAERVGAAAYLVAVPDRLYGDPDLIVDFFRRVASGCGLPLVVQDLRFHGPGMDLDTIRRLRDELPTLVGLKIETLPAGPKYTAVRDEFGAGLWVAGGWAVTQLIEALDRGVDAMMPESSMVRVYAAIQRAHAAGNRDRALSAFRELLPVLAYTNQEIVTSIAFFKRLLVRKGIFGTPELRATGFAWDRFNERIADELIDHYLDLERRLGAERPGGPGRAEKGARP